MDINANDKIILEAIDGMKDETEKQNLKLALKSLRDARLRIDNAIMNCDWIPVAMELTELLETLQGKNND